jgi:hypothetical protein
VVCGKDRAAAVHCRHDQHPLPIPLSRNPAIPARRDRELALAAMPLDRPGAILGGRERSTTMADEFLQP